MRNSAVFCLTIIALLLTGIALDANEVPPLQLEDGDGSYCAGRCLEILEDPSGKATFDDVRSPAYSKTFIRSTKDIPNFSFSKSVYWARFTVRFPSGAKQSDRWIMKYRWPFVSSITAYIGDGGGSFRKVETGCEASRESRDIPYRLFLFTLHAAPGAESTVYLRLQSTGILIFPVYIVAEKTMALEMDRDNLFFGVFLGIMLMIIFHHLLLFSAVRDRDYIYFSLFVASQLVIHALNDGIINWHLGLSGTHMQYWMMSSACVSAVIMVLFSSHILDLRTVMPRMARVFTGLAAAFVLFAIAGFAFPSLLSWNRFFALTFIANLILLGTSVTLMLRGFRIAVYFTVFILLIICTGFISSLLRADLLPYNWFSEHIRPLALIAEVFILSLAIARRIRTLNRQRILAQEESIRNLEKADRIKDEFIASTSHELRTPIHGIVGLSDIMMKNSRLQLTNDVKENLQLISSSGRRLLSIINDLLDFSRMKQADLQLNRKAVDLRGTVAVVYSLLSPLTAGKSVELRNSVSPGIPPVFADEDRLKQILTNLVGNALKFTPSGVIDVSAEPAENGMVLIHVTDTGIGIKPGDAKRIFEPFEQGEPSATRRHDGAGLGLAITKNLVELLGGHLDLASKHGKGSTFSFTLPSAHIFNAVFEQTERGSVFDQNLSVIPLRATKPRTAETGENHPGSPLFLIIDDDPVSAKILGDFLDIKGYGHIAANDGKKALALLKQNPQIQMVLLDVMMPGMSGFDVLKKIRRERSDDDLPVILTTAKSQLDDVSRGFEAGANDYITKPFNVDELSRRIDNLLIAMKIIEKKESGLSVRSRGAEHFLRFSDIIYLSSSGKNTVVHTAEQDIESTAMMKLLDTRLPSNFMRIHKQHIINIDHLARIEHRESWSCEVVMKDSDDTRLPVGRTFIAELRKKMAGETGKDRG